MTNTSSRSRRLASRLAGVIFTIAAAAAASASAAATSSTPAASVEHLHTLAVVAFRQGRLAEAYGRFVALADAGHAASARQALWMCEYGSSLFGREWDCAPHQVADWSAAAGMAAPSWSTCAGPLPRQAAHRGPRR